MRKFFTILLAYFFVSNFAFGQDEMKNSEIISYNQEIGDWDIVFPLTENFCIDSITDALIMINGQVPLHAFASERGIQLSRRDTLKLYSGERYFFKPFFLYKGYWYTMPGKNYEAPTIFSTTSWDIKDLYLKTSVIFSTFPGLIPDEEKSYFSVIDASTDSIIHGEIEKIPVERSEGNKFFGMKELSSVGEEEEQYLNSVVAFSNQFGEPKLYFLSLARFKIGGEFTLSNNIVGVGSITLFWGDNLPKKMEIISLESGQVIQKKEVIAGESFWLENLRPGNYVLSLPGIGQKRITKI